jgi:hypothetical protein
MGLRERRDHDDKRILGKCPHPNLKVARFVNNDTKPPTIGLDFSCPDCSTSWSEVA